MLDSWLHDYNSLPCNCPKNVGPIRGSDSTFELPTRDGWNPNIAKASSFVQSLKAEELGKTIVFSAIIPPSPMCIYIYIYILYTIYIINVAGRSFQDFKLHSGGFFTEKNQLIPSMRAPHKSPCELHYGVLLGNRRHLPSWSDGIFRPVKPPSLHIQSTRSQLRFHVV